MPWNEDHYDFDKEGNFRDTDELDRAVDNGDLTRISNGYWDKETDTEYWNDGTKK